MSQQIPFVANLPKNTSRKLRPFVCRETKRPKKCHFPLKSTSNILLSCLIDPLPILLGTKPNSYLCSIRSRHFGTETQPSFAHQRHAKIHCQTIQKPLHTPKTFIGAHTMISSLVLSLFQSNTPMEDISNIFHNDLLPSLGAKANESIKLRKFIISPYDSCYR